MRKKGVFEPLPAMMARLSMPIPECGCYAWLGIMTADGYTRVRYFREGKRITKNAARTAYELALGPIPEGLEIDHLCRSTWCVNPDHLEAVTPRKNIERRPYQHLELCPKGHQRISKPERGRKQRWICLECERERQAAYYRQRKGA